MAEKKEGSIEEQPDIGSTEIPVTRPDYVMPEGSDEERNEEYIDPPVVEVPEEEVSDVEEEAKSQGWKPPDEFEADDKEFVSAAEFLRRGELFDKIKDLKQTSRSETRRLEKQIRELNKSIQDSRKQGYEQALKDIEAKRQDAVEIGDIDAFRALDSQYDKVKEQIAEASKPEVDEVYEPSVSQEAIEFQQRHQDWFNNNTPENTAMVNQAVAIDNYFTENKPFLTDGQRLKLVEKELKNLYPHRFVNARKKQPAPVEASSKASVQATGGSHKIRVEDLNDEQKHNFKAFKELDPNLTIDDFVKAARLEYREDLS